MEGKEEGWRLAFVCMLMLLLVNWVGLVGEEEEEGGKEEGVCTLGCDL
jgi:hypothetical protein